MRAKQWMTRLMIGAGLVFAAQGALAGTIAGSPHDFSNRGWGTNEICIFCHAPHNTSLAVTDAPLWNHAQSVATYQLYSSATFNVGSSQPGGVSKLCLSCHDGTIAIDSYGTRTGTTNLTGSEVLGTDLRDDHPIGFTYDATLATNPNYTLKNPTTTNITIGSGGTTKTGTITATILFGGKVECATCHDVHNTYTATGKLLKVSNAASGFCLSCHIK